WQDCAFKELLVPLNRIAIGKFRHALRLKAEEARRHSEIRHGTPRKLDRELGPHRFEEPPAHNDPQHSQPDLRCLHASPPLAVHGGMLNLDYIHVNPFFHSPALLKYRLTTPLASF